MPSKIKLLQITYLIISFQITYLIISFLLPLSIASILLNNPIITTLVRVLTERSNQLKKLHLHSQRTFYRVIHNSKLGLLALLLLLLLLFFSLFRLSFHNRKITPKMILFRGSTTHRSLYKHNKIIDNEISFDLFLFILITCNFFTCVAGTTIFHQSDHFIQFQ